MVKKSPEAMAVVPASDTAADETAMKSFTHGVKESDPDFSYGRYWYPERDGRIGVEQWIHDKCVLGDHPKFGHAAKVEVLLPPSAPSDYANLDFLLQRFDETLPPFEKHALIQTKIFLDEEEAWHLGYERVRSFARVHFAQRFPTVLIAHIPSVGGLVGNGSHIHCAVLSRGLTINGFTGACTELCSDKGYRAARDAWRAHKKTWDAAA